MILDLDLASAAKLVYILVLLWVVVCIWRGQRAEEINLWELVTATDRNNVDRTDARKFYECGAFLVMTVSFALMVVLDKLSEWYAATYVGAFVLARWARDREQRLNRALEQQKQPAQ